MLAAWYVGFRGPSFLTGDEYFTSKEKSSSRSLRTVPDWDDCYQSLVRQILSTGARGVDWIEYPMPTEAKLRQTCAQKSCDGSTEELKSRDMTLSPDQKVT